MTVSTGAVKYLKSISSVRETTSQVFQYAQERGEANYFKLNLAKMGSVVDFLSEIIARDYGTDYAAIPPHGRWQHLNCGGVQRVEALIARWSASGVDEVEIARKLIDLFVFSVLVDAGAGNVWKFTAAGAEPIGRSEGLAVASYALFDAGALSSDASDPHKVNGARLSAFTQPEFDQGFQISDTNPMNGSEGRRSLIQRLGRALESNVAIFGPEARPGAIVDYLYGKSVVEAAGRTIDLNDLWDALMDGLTSIWPATRTTVDGESLGDAWRLDTKADAYAALRASDAVPAVAPEVADIVTFHKLTQWLCYSLLVPLESYGHKFLVRNKQLQTGLPEYRNGGLFYDFGVLELNPAARARGLELSASLSSAPQGSKPEIPTFAPDDGVIVEWRCLTIGLLDYLLPLLNKKLNYTLALPQLIEAGSWKAGREIAAKLRPSTGGPPIELHSDGTVF
ncbi:LAMI_0F10242g1_1 [Lachancea mirantina]|uniref:LAMI_0F10242g1_1 n=1 Tax=Lachancea mirantina TaxID=1230905 RepID=A0A1G4K1N5_9SACH|nr:LAMI_0F10242g1_1 [Lachancea mirantina]